ncbi:MAG TPA: helix-turn-helix transcriptional regulator [Allosphingosinicella sp.]|jgi:DNA-binding CsgD family transcriptional regulator
MSDERLDRLTDKQRECLRLVYAHLSSKEIAPRLRVEPGTVDQYIKAAMRTLGVSDRRAAARMLAEHESGTPRPLVYQPLDIAQIGEPAMFVASTEGRRKAVSGGAVREDQAVFEVLPTHPPEPFKLPLPIQGGRPRDLSPIKRLGWILGLILLLAFAFGSFVTGFEALSRLR